MNKLDTMNKVQRAIFGRRLYGRIRLRHNAATRIMLERMRVSSTTRKED